MTVVAVLHPGEMGAAVGAALVDVGVDAVWLAAGRSADTSHRATAAGMHTVADLRGCDLVLSVCPPGAAVEVAQDVVRQGFSGLYVDANAVSPATAAEVAAIVTGGAAAYVDGGIIGPPPQEPGTTRLYLSGERAADVAAILHESRLEPVVLDAGPFAASATKMTYAAWTKVSAALLLATRDAARALDVEDVLRAEWETSQPDLADRLRAAERSAVTKGWRWEAEMREIARTFGEAGLPPGLGAAAAEVFGGYKRPAAGA
jgi:3-hydroxyisobutyrate dehydrogenase-like beta-hydroxyacid dehydrogenase